jgi:hypothetical protein
VTEFDPLPLLEKSGVSALTKFSSVLTVTQALKQYLSLLDGTRGLDLEAARVMAFREVKAHAVQDGRRFVLAAFADRAAQHGAAAASVAQGEAVAFADPEPWPAAVNGAELLARLQRFAGRFLALPRGADVLVPAFVVATYAVEIFPVAPYLVLHSPAPQCGKTRVLEVFELLVRRAWRTIVPSTAVLFRVLQESAPTLLLDEAEVVNGRGDAAADVRALLQSGYRLGAFVPRCVGDANEVRNFRVFGPKVFALIGQLPPALFDRCIPVEMQRRPRAAQLARFRPLRLAAEALELRRAARRWVSDHGRELAEVDPPPLDALDERQQEVWDPLFAIGQVAGGDWYERLTTAALAMSGGREPGSLGLTLLADVEAVFGTAEWLASADVAQALNALEGRPWADWNRGKGLTPNALARLLKPFGVAPLPTGEKRIRGYRREAFKAAWAAYVHVEPLNRSAPSNDANKAASDNRSPDGARAVADSPGNPHGDSLLSGRAVENAGGSALWVNEGEAEPDPDPDLDPDTVARDAQREGA